MNKSQIIALFDQDQRVDVTIPSMRREVSPNVIRHVNTSGSGEGIITYSQLNETNAAETIREQVRYLTEDASPMSRPNLQKFGFEMLAYSYPCKWKRARPKPGLLP